MKILAAALLSLSFLAASAVAGADASADLSPDTNLDEAELVATLEGGHWRSGDAKGTYRVILENVGFEHVSCRVWIEWLADARSGGAKSGQPPRVVARVPYAEISNGFWSCGPKRNGLSGVTLTIPAKHAYSGEARKFQAVLGAPGDTAIAAPAAEPRRGRRPCRRAAQRPTADSRSACGSGWRSGRSWSRRGAAGCR